MSDDESWILDELRNNQNDHQRNPIDDSDFSFSEESSKQQQYRSQNQISVDQSAGLTKRMVEKIAMLQNIALDHNIANRANNLNSALNIEKNSIKLSDQEFVSFSNTVMKNLDNGILEFMCIKPQKDMVMVEYRFDELETTGSFKSNVQNAKSGLYTIIMKNVLSNVSTGFNHQMHTALKPTKFQYANANIKINDGTETQVFDDALERKYLNVLENAVSSEVLRSTNKGMIAQMKNEIQKPVVFRNMEQKNKLFDMRWMEDNMAMELSNIGLQNSEQAVQQMLKSVSFQRKSENTYRMRYDFTFKDMEWTSTLAVEWTGKKMNIPSINFKIGKVDIQVIITKSCDQQQSCGCGMIDTNVMVRGLQYKLNDNVQPELMTKIKNELRRFIEHSWESCIQESLKQELCNTRKY